MFRNHASFAVVAASRLQRLSPSATRSDLTSICQRPRRRRSHDRVHQLSVPIPYIRFNPAITSMDCSWNPSTVRPFSTQRTNDEDHDLTSSRQQQREGQDNRPYETESLRPYQQKARKFLEQVKNGRIQRALVTQKAEEHLLQCVSETDQHVPSDGPLAIELLDIGISNANIPIERRIPRLFSLACQILVRCGHPLAFQYVHRQLWRLLDGQKEFLVFNERRHRKRDIAYNSRYVNDACSQLIHFRVMKATREKQVLDKRTIEQLRRLIQRLEQCYEDPSIPLLDDGVIEEAIVMFLCHHSNAQEAFLRVQSKLQNRKPSDIVPYKPTVSTLTSIIMGFARQQEPQKARGVIDWILKCDDEGQEMSVIVPQPNEACFNALIHAYAVDGGNEAGYKAEEVLAWMQNLHETKGLDTAPTTTSFNIVINAWARSEHPDAPAHAEKLLQQMIKSSEGGHVIRPSEESWCSVMNAYANSGDSRSMERVASILDLMEHLSLSMVPYTTYVKALENGAKRLRGIDKQRCKDMMLQVINRVVARGVVPSPDLYNAVLTGLTEVSAIDGVLYFLELERQYRRGNIRMNARTFNIGLNAIASLNKPDAEERTLDALGRMEEYEKADAGMTPTTLTMNIILKTLSRSNAPDAASRSDDLLREMDKTSFMSPDSTSYVTCIIAWGRGQASDKFDRVKDLLNRFLESTDKEKNTKHDGIIAVFNAGLSVCHHNSRQQNCCVAIQTAVAMMEELRKRPRICPDQRTYSSFFAVFKNSNLDIDREGSGLNQVLRKEFGFCISDGLVSNEILRIVAQHAPSIVEDNFGKQVDLKSFAVPGNWSRNVDK